MRRKLLARTASAAALSFCAASAMAQTVTLNGGGATLPQPTYTTEFGAYTNATPSVLFSYDGVGSGGGQTAFLNNDISQFNSPSNQYGTIVGTTVHFGASDAFLNSTQVSATGGYTRSGTDGPLIQLPMIGIAVAIPFVNQKLGAGLLKLTDAQICGVLSGKLTDWSQIAGNATPGTIQVVYRSDSSGTTFILTQHLNAVCTASNSSFPVLPVPITKTFASLFTGSVPPANFTGESGSSAVATQMLATPLSFGYLSPDFTSIAPKSPNTNSLNVAAVVNGINNVNYKPTVTNIEKGLKNPGPGSTDPTPPTSKSAAQNPLNWVPAIPQTNQGYPIVGYTTWEVSSCYASATVAHDMVSFLSKHYQTASYKTIITNNGFAPLANTAAAPFVSAVVTTFLNNSSGYNLNINNGTLCAGLPGR